MEICPKCKRVHTTMQWCVTNENGEYHSYNGRHAIQLFDRPSKTIEKFWYSNGKNENDFGPSYTVTCINGKILIEEYKGSGATGTYYFDLPLEKINSLNVGDSFINGDECHVLLRQVNPSNSRYKKVFLSLKNGTRKSFIAIYPQLEHA